MNAITLEMLERLGEHLAALDRDESVRAIILTGAGKGFCAAMDLKEAAAGRGIGGSGVLSPGGGAGHLSNRELITVTLHRIDVPVICALDGPAAGYGFDLALGCDLRLTSDRAKLVPGFAKRGIVPERRHVAPPAPRRLGEGLRDRLPRRADPRREGARARPRPSASSPTGISRQRRRVAEQIAVNAPLAIRAMKRLFRHGLSEDFESDSHHVLMQLLLLFRSGDFEEGVKAFLERRDPRFEGK